MTDSDTLAAVKLLRAVEGGFCIVPEGVFFTDQRIAEIFAKKHHKRLIQINEPISGWLAQNQKADSN